jgi:hypothetical protein
MKKIFFLFLIMINLFAIVNTSKIENIMGEKNYQKYQKLIAKIFPNDEYNITEIVKKLKNNGLIDLFFDKAKIIDTKFEFQNGNPILEQKILNNSLSNLGYYYFYPIEISKIDNIYNVTLEMKSEHFIDPVSIINELNSRGCEILDISRNYEVFNYKIDCSNGFIKEVKDLTNEEQSFVNPNGVYWIKNNNFFKLYIKTSNLDTWHPSVWFYDKEMNLIDVFRKNVVINLIYLDIPPACEYIKITDIYSPENFKRGIIIKGK